METFQRYLSSIDKENVAVFDLHVSSPDLYGWKRWKNEL